MSLIEVCALHREPSDLGGLQRPRLCPRHQLQPRARALVASANTGTGTPSRRTTPAEAHRRGPPSVENCNNLREIGLRLAELAQSVNVQFAFQVSLKEEHAFQILWRFQILDSDIYEPPLQCCIVLFEAPTAQINHPRFSFTKGVICALGFVCGGEGLEGRLECGAR